MTRRPRSPFILLFGTEGFRICPGCKYPSRPPLTSPSPLPSTGTLTLGLPSGLVYHLRSSFVATDSPGVEEGTCTPSTASSSQLFSLAATLTPSPLSVLLSPIKDHFRSFFLLGIPLPLPIPSFHAPIGANDDSLPPPPSPTPARVTVTKCKTTLPCR